MSKISNADTERRLSDPAGRRPLTARSVIASTLLGVHPPRLPTRHLVRCGALFGISEGAIRTAISRMVAAGELEADADGYRLAGELLARQARQDTSRRPEPRPWTGRWDLAVVTGAGRPAEERAALREAMRRLKMAELREGTWLRPSNLDPGRFPADRHTVDAQCHWFEAAPGQDAAALAAQLWDLAGWADGATTLIAEMDALSPPLAAGDPVALAPAFETSAAVLRHLLADPLLPDDLLPAPWPGATLRATYDRFNATFVEKWAGWLRAQA